MIIRTKNSVYEVETTEAEHNNDFKITKIEAVNESVFNKIGQVRYAYAMHLQIGDPAVFKCDASDDCPYGNWVTSDVEAIEI